MTSPLLLGGPCSRPAEWALPSDNALIFAGVASMLVEGVQCHHGTTETLVTYEAQLIMYCSQVVDDGPLILSIFATPQAVSITSETLEGIGIMNSL